jgi:hypothetical protein
MLTSVELLTRARASYPGCAEKNSTPTLYVMHQQHQNNQFLLLPSPSAPLERSTCWASNHLVPQFAARKAFQHYSRAYTKTTSRMPTMCHPFIHETIRNLRQLTVAAARFSIAMPAAAAAKVSPANIVLGAASAYMQRK